MVFCYHAGTEPFPSLPSEAWRVSRAGPQLAGNSLEPFAATRISVGAGQFRELVGSNEFPVRVKTRLMENNNQLFQNVKERWVEPWRKTLYI